MAVKYIFYFSQALIRDFLKDKSAAASYQFLGFLLCLQLSILFPLQMRGIFRVSQYLFSVDILDQILRRFVPLKIPHASEACSLFKHRINVEIHLIPLNSESVFSKFALVFAKLIQAFEMNTVFPSHRKIYCYFRKTKEGS